MAKYLDLNGLETVWGKVTDKITESKADWNQNDETADDYVKNRTHWTEKVDVAIVENLSLALQEDNSLQMAVFQTQYLYYISQPITVIWDNISYICNVSQGSPGLYLGNPSFIFGPSAPDTGEPFAIVMQSSDGGISWNCTFGCTTLPTTNSLTMLATEEKVHKLDNKYLDVTVAQNILDGSASSSVRTIGSEEESDTYTMGQYAFAEGYETVASGYASHAEGIRTTASGYNSHAEGSNTTASNNYAHAEGSGCTASGYYSHAEGLSTTAGGEGAHAEGYDTTASGGYSHAEGYGTTASESYSHAEGCYTEASNYYAHAEGYYTLASSSYQHVQGKYNLKDASNKYAHIVGNGSGPSTSTRSNAHTLDWDGNGWFQGNVYVGGTGQDDTTAIKILPAKLVSTETTPTTNDTICWLYE